MSGSIWQGRRDHKNASTSNDKFKRWKTNLKDKKNQKNLSKAIKVIKRSKFKLQKWKTITDQIYSLDILRSTVEIESVGLRTDQYNLPNLNNREKGDLDSRVMALHIVRAWSWGHWLANELTSVGSVPHEGQVFCYHHKGPWPSEWSLIVILATNKNKKSKGRKRTFPDLQRVKNWHLTYCLSAAKEML